MQNAAAIIIIIIIIIIIYFILIIVNGELLSIRQWVDDFIQLHIHYISRHFLVLKFLSKEITQISVFTNGGVCMCCVHL